MSRTAVPMRARRPPELGMERSTGIALGIAYGVLYLVLARARRASTATFRWPGRSWPGGSMRDACQGLGVSRRLRPNGPRVVLSRGGMLGWFGRIAAWQVRVVW
jgi:hypothetical protein